MRLSVQRSTPYSIQHIAWDRKTRTHSLSLDSLSGPLQVLGHQRITVAQAIPSNTT